jgi:hypothetical protein
MINSNQNEPNRPRTKGYMLGMIVRLQLQGVDPLL